MDIYIGLVIIIGITVWLSIYDMIGFPVMVGGLVSASWQQPINRQAAATYGRSTKPPQTLQV